MIRQPTDPTGFITGLRERMATGLVRLDAALVAGTAGGVAVTARREPWISVPKPAALPEPVNLAGICAIVATGEHEQTEAALHRARLNLAAALAREAST